MIILFHPNFKKAYRKRFGGNKKLIERFDERMAIFTANSTEPILHNHHLTGSMREFWSFSVTGDVRVIYRKLTEDKMEFFDIGSHNQVY